MKLSLYTSIQIVVLIILFLLFPAWWWIMIVPFVFCLIMTSKFGLSFWSSFFAVLVVWGIRSLWVYFSGAQIITQRMADLFGIHQPALFIFVILILGSISSAIAGITGTSLRTFFIETKPKNPYY